MISKVNAAVRTPAHAIQQALSDDCQHEMRQRHETGALEWRVSDLAQVLRNAADIAQAGAQIAEAHKAGGHGGRGDVRPPHIDAVPTGR